MKNKTLQLIADVKTEEDMMRFSRFDFKNEYKARFLVFSLNTTCEIEVSDYASPLKAFRSWNKKEIRCNRMPFVKSMDSTFSLADLEIHTPCEKTKAYQEFLYKVSERIQYIEDLGSGKLL
ncbi:MAG: hypothetical protein KAS66_03475 [Candidatus Omnitrophica bacterium]|nr:hypothetical protein [Candidatus Omnitrophota bacterium]